jgi:dTDP-4-dehydrorhamnose 3,5-epimerase-like enzyme
MGADRSEGNRVRTDVSVEDCTLIELPVVEDRQGNLAFAEARKHVPFPIARVFYVYDVPATAQRGGHAHLELEEAVFCLHGRLEIALDDGERRRRVVLDDPRVGIHLPPLTWYDIDGFAAGTVYLVFASAPYEEADYIRDHERFLAMRRGLSRP